jgi:hypothetical protein
MTRSLSHTRASCPNSFSNVLTIGGPHTSWDMRLETPVHTFCPGSTSACPECLAMIFSVSVIGLAPETATAVGVPARRALRWAGARAATAGPTRGPAVKDEVDGDGDGARGANAPDATLTNAARAMADSRVAAGARPSGRRRAGWAAAHLTRAGRGRVVVFCSQEGSARVQITPV